MLKQMTKYYCALCNKYGRYTGASSEADRVKDTHCGQFLTEDVPSNCLWRVSFEVVNPITHPQFYLDEKPCVSADEVPEDVWCPVSRETRSEKSARDQVRGLLEEQKNGHLVRNTLVSNAPVQEFREMK